LKVLHVSFSDFDGGAARACYRIHSCLLEAGIQSNILVCHSRTDDFRVLRPTSSWSKLAIQLRTNLVKPLKRLSRTSNLTMHSFGIFRSNLLKYINSCDADIVNLHWINDEMLSITDIPKIDKPLVWTFHDMWPFCGAEHYTDGTRWADGYSRDNRPDEELGLDLNLWVWKRKCRYWRTPFPVVAPSEWLYQCVKTSSLMREWPVYQVVYPINTERWSPLSRRLARQILGLPTEVPLVIFGAAGGTRDLRKGFDLLREAIPLVKKEGSLAKFELLIFGQSEPEIEQDYGVPTRYMGHVYDELTMRIALNAADVMVVPSRLDNLPLTAIEAQSCGVPVVCFDNSGVKTVVDHLRSGYVARAFDITDLASGIIWCLSMQFNGGLTQMVRESALEKFCNKRIASRYCEIYESLC
jgi:glycosyltransferase involved in cell wall biosynthesis